MMNREKAKSLAQELSIEYLKENGIFKSDSKEIPDIVNEFAKTYQSFFEAIAHNYLPNIL